MQSDALHLIPFDFVHNSDDFFLFFDRVFCYFVVHFVILLSWSVLLDSSIHLNRVRARISFNRLPTLGDLVAGGMVCKFCLHYLYVLQQ